MKYRVKVLGTFDTVAHRDAALAQLLSLANSKPKYDLQSASIDEGGVPGLMAMARYVKGDADNVESTIKSSLSSVTGLLSALVSWHQCSHDQAGESWYNCKSPTAQYRETRFP